MSGVVDSLYTSFAGPRNLVKKMLPTIPPPPLSSDFFISVFKKRRKRVWKEEKAKS
jgi:hypothetical protein